jgi:large subunit ribosomal protein L21
MTYAIISLGGKQHRVHEGERLLVNRVPQDEGKKFHPDVLLLGGNGEPEFAPKGVQVTVRVVGHLRGDKVRIGKYRPKTGYRRHTGFRARLSQIEIEAIGAKKATSRKEEAEPKPDAEQEQGAISGLPKGYEELTVAQINEQAKRWRRAQLEVALAYEQQHGKRKGALHALDVALAAEKESG